MNATRVYANKLLNMNKIIKNNNNNKRNSWVMRMRSISIKTEYQFNEKINLDKYNLRRVVEDLI